MRDMSRWNIQVDSCVRAECHGVKEAFTLNAGSGLRQMVGMVSGRNKCAREGAANDGFTRVTHHRCE